MAFNPQLPFHAIVAGSMGASITSPVIHPQYQDNIGIQLVWTGTPTGVFTVQVSVDHAQDMQGVVTNAGTWTTLTLSASITASGSADNAYIDLNQLSAPYYRVVYTRTSGTGTLDMYCTAKGV